jgi:WD40 repeat protein
LGCAPIDVRNSSPVLIRIEDMIKRRTFLGSVTTLFAAGTSQARAAALSKGSFVTLGLDRLDWDCRVIETVSHRSDRRKPVVTGIDIDAAGKLMAVVGDDHLVGIYNFRDEEFSEHLDRHTDWVRTARFSNQGNLLATAGNDRQLLIWEVNDLKAPVLTKRNSEAIIKVAFSPDDSKIATVGFEPWLRIFDTTDGSKIQKLRCACPDNHAIAFSKDGELIAAAGRCGRVRVWNATTGQQTAEYKAHRKRVRSLEFTANNLLVSGGDDQIVTIADPNNTKAMRQLPRLSSKLYSLQLLNQGMIATGGSNNRIQISRLSDGSAVGSLAGHTGTVSCLALTGDQLVSGSYDTQVRVWSPGLEVSAPQQIIDRHTQLDQGWTNKR